MIRQVLASGRRRAVAGTNQGCNCGCQCAAQDPLANGKGVRARSSNVVVFPEPGSPRMSSKPVASYFGADISIFQRRVRRSGHLDRVLPGRINGRRSPKAFGLRAVFSICCRERKKRSKQVADYEVAFRGNRGGKSSVGHWNSVL
jgi:hypothetical protein